MPSSFPSLARRLKSPNRTRQVLRDIRGDQNRCVTKGRHDSPVRADLIELRASIAAVCDSSEKHH